MIKNMTEEQRAVMPTLIASCTKCGKLVACSVADPERAKDNAKTVASWVRDGLTVSTVTVAQVREAEWCDCPRGKEATA